MTVLPPRNPIQQVAARLLSECAATNLEQAKVVADGIGDRDMRNELKAALSLTTSIRNFSFRRSHSDSLLQVADYCAGIVNRALLDKEGASAYESQIETKPGMRLIWP